MTNVHIGTMGWSYKFWIGNFYRNDLKAQEFLGEYSKQFDTVEVDSTFYRVPYRTTITKWRHQTPNDFLFSLKFPRIITHTKMLGDCEREIERFIEIVAGLKNKLGPILIQLPPAFKAQHLPILRDFLIMLPDKYRYALEVRNVSLLGSELYATLQKNGVALVLLDRSFFPKTEVLTADFSYVRWEGNRKSVNGTSGKIEVDRTADIKIWAQKITEFSDISIEVFGYFSKYYSGHPPTDAKKLLSFL